MDTYVLSKRRMQSDTPKVSEEARCPRCWKPVGACFCAEIQAVPTRTRLLILQHPQEAKKPLGTARLVSLALPGAVHRVGLSWRSLSAALGEAADPKEWAVLFLGGLKESQKHLTEAPFQIVTRKGEPVAPQRIKGVVLLDGNWKQSKTLWWRNAWLLKLSRIVINPSRESAYGSVRKQPRRECLSTIEAAAETLDGLDASAGAGEKLRELFKRHLERAQTAAS